MGATQSVKVGTTDIVSQECGDARDVAGCYIDNWRRVILVTQNGSKVTVSCECKPTEGTVDGNIISVSSFNSNGTIDDKGNVSFSDFGYWQKLFPCEGKGCHDLTGMYIDNHMKKIKVGQNGHMLIINYAGQMIEGFICGEKDCCTGTVHVATFLAAGVIDSSGNVKFGDGGTWVKQAEAAKDLSKQSSYKTEFDFEFGAGAKLTYKVPRKEDFPECSHPSVTLAPKTFGAMKLKAAKRSQETESVRNWFSKSRAITEPEGNEVQREGITA